MKEYKNKKLFQVYFICIRLHRKSNKDNVEGKLFNPIPAKPRLTWQSQCSLNLMSGTHKVSDHHLHQEQQQQPKMPQTSQQLTEFSSRKPHGSSAAIQCPAFLWKHVKTSFAYRKHSRWWLDQKLHASTKTVEILIATRIPQMTYRPSSYPNAEGCLKPKP
jgi:hypothetical protein